MKREPSDVIPVYKDGSLLPVWRCIVCGFEEQVDEIGQYLMEEHLRTHGKRTLRNVVPVGRAELVTGTILEHAVVVVGQYAQVSRVYFYRDCKIIVRDGGLFFANTVDGGEIVFEAGCLESFNRLEDCDVVDLR